jgi:hypothetical protein
MKPHMVIVTNEVEIESIRMNGLKDIRGGCVNGVWLAYPESVERFRKANAGQYSVT